MLKISIITICLNSEKTIEETISSIRNQTYKNIEYIIIDGNSKDSTKKIIQNNLDIINNYISEKDSGIYSALNKGINFASGDIVCILNSDDCFINKFAVEEICHEFKNESIDALYSDIVFKDRFFKNLTKKYYSSSIFSPKRLKYGLMPAHPGLVLRISVYKKYGLFDESYKIAGDFEYIARIFFDGSIKYRYIKKVFVEMKTGGVSTNLKNKKTLMYEILRACKKNKINTNIFNLFLGFIFKKFKQCSIF